MDETNIISILEIEKHCYMVDSLRFIYLIDLLCIDTFCSFFFSSYIQYAFLCQLCQFLSLGIKDVIKKIKLFNFSSWIINKNEIERGRKH